MRSRKQQTGGGEPSWAMQGVMKVLLLLSSVSLISCFTARRVERAASPPPPPPPTCPTTPPITPPPTTTTTTLTVLFSGDARRGLPPPLLSLTMDTIEAIEDTMEDIEDTMEDTGDVRRDLRRLNLLPSLTMGTDTMGTDTDTLPMDIIGDRQR